MNKSIKEISKTLAQLPIGEESNVISIAGNSVVTKRLMEMGIVPGVAVRVVKTAPFGCPIQIRVRGYNLAIRRSEANSIEIKG
jgi:Fe2+ transport system protein FeoA